MVKSLRKNALPAICLLFFVFYRLHRPWCILRQDFELSYYNISGMKTQTNFAKTQNITKSRHRFPSVTAYLLKKEAPFRLFQPSESASFKAYIYHTFELSGSLMNCKPDRNHIFQIFMILPCSQYIRHHRQNHMLPVSKYLFLRKIYRLLFLFALLKDKHPLQCFS